MDFIIQIDELKIIHHKLFINFCGCKFCCHFVVEHSHKFIPSSFPAHSQAYIAHSLNVEITAQCCILWNKNGTKLFAFSLGVMFTWYVEPIY